MTRRHGTMTAFVIAALTAGCSAGAAKTEMSAAPAAPPASGAAASPSSAAATSVSAAAAVPAATTVPAGTTVAAATAVPAATAGTAATSGTAGAGSVSPAAASAGSGSVAAPATSPDTPEMIRRRAQIQWALRQDEIKNDPHGQWAVEASASSSYNDARGTAPHAPSQATGAPNVQTYTNDIAAWTPKTADSGIEWLDLTFSKPVHATSVRIRESYGAGAIVKVEVFDEQGAPHTVWSGLDPTKELDYLTAVFPRTAFKTARVKVTLATNSVPGFKQIDAVQLVGTEQ